MEAPKFSLVVYIGKRFCDGLEVAKVINKCGFNEMEYGEPANADTWFYRDYFAGNRDCYSLYMQLDLETHLVAARRRSALDGSMLLVDVEDLKKSISYKRLDGGKGKGPGHFELSKLFNMPKYKDAIQNYNIWCDEYITKKEEEEQERKRREEEEIERQKQIELENVERKKREEEEMKRQKQIESDRAWESARSDYIHEIEQKWRDRGWHEEKPYDDWQYRKYEDGSCYDDRW